MELRRSIAILRRWAWLLMAGAAVAGVVAYGVARGQTTRYEATATVLVNQAQGAGGAAYQDVLANQQLSKTYANLVHSRPVLEQVAGNLNVAPSALRGAVTAGVVRDTQLITITARHTDPRFAATAANETARVFGEQIRDVQGARQGSQEQEVQSQVIAVQTAIDQGAAELSRLNARPLGVSEDQRQQGIAQTSSRLESLRSNLFSLQRQLQDLHIGAAKSVNSVRLVEPAIAPSRPVAPRPRLSALLAGMAGLLVAVGVVATIEYLDDTVKNAADVYRTTGVAMLGAITRFTPRHGMAAGRRGPRRLITSLDSRSPIVEAYRMVRTNLEFIPLDQPTRTILITSAGSGEGKSTTAANLALIVAQTGRRVILVDADMRDPSLHHLFDAPNTTGLSTLIGMAESLDDSSITRSLRSVAPAPRAQQDDQHGDRSGGRPATANLLLLPSGPPPPNPVELLSSVSMTRVVDLLSERADVVLFDSPPLLDVADASVLAGRLNGVILVAEAGRTRAGALTRCAGVLTHARANAWGVVLNRLTMRPDEQYDGSRAGSGPEL